MSNIPINRSRTPCAEKHDKLKWSAGFTFRAEDLVFGIRCQPAEFLDEIRAMLPQLPEPSDDHEVDVLYSFRQGGETRRGTRNFHLVYRDWNRVKRTMDFEEAKAAFQELIFTDHVRPATRNQNVFCPGLTGQIDNRVVMVVGPEAERERVAHAWRERGVPFFSTQVVSLDSEGRVHPCPMLDEQLPELTPAPVDCLVFLDAEPQPLSPGRAVLRLLERTGGSEAPHRLTSLSQALQKAHCCSLDVEKALRDPFALCG